MSISQFRIQYPPLDTAGSEMLAVPIPDPTEEHNFYIPTTPADIGKSIATAVMECAPVLGLEPDYNDVCTLAASIICGFFPHLIQQVEEEFKWTGIKLRKIRLPSEDEQYLVIMATEATQIKYAYIFFAQVVLLMFQNVNELNYENFIVGRLTALKEIVGLPMTDTRGLRAFAPRQATEIRQCLGAQDKLRKLTVKELIYCQENYQDTPLGKVCSYCLSLISWADMAGLKFVYDMLIVTKSPVMDDRDVLAEVIRLADAMRLICRSRYPQFFRILADFRDSQLCQRSNFPTLIAVAQELSRRANNSQVSQFVRTSEVQSPLVTRLVDLHLASNNQV